MDIINFVYVALGISMVCNRMKGFFFGSQHHFDNDYRLPGDFTPLSYNLSFVFAKSGGNSHSGNVQIVVYCNKTTNQLTLHADPNTISIANVSIEAPYHVAMDYIKLTWNRTRQTFTVTVDKQFQHRKTYTLTLDYQVKTYDAGSIEPPARFHGVNKTRGLTEVRQPSYIMALFQSNEARMAFPCFDEPKFRSIFQLKVQLIGYENHIAVLSNTKGYKTYNSTWIFERTLPMATYLLHLNVGPYVEICESFSPSFAALTNAKNYCIWYSPDLMLSHLSHAQFRPETIDDSSNEAHSLIQTHSYMRQQLPKIRKTVEKTVTSITQYFKSYLSPGTFNIAFLPMRRPISGMETWGLIQMNSKTILNEKFFEQVLRHEIIHYWFGNLVTPHDWKDVCLSESLDGYLNTELFDSYIGTELLPPADIPSSIVSHRWTQDLSTPKCYKHGDIVTGMFSAIIGKDVFRDILNRYIRQYSFKSVTTDQFLDAVDDELELKQWPQRESIIAAWRSYLYLRAYPLVLAKYNHHKQQLELFQQQYDATSTSTKYWVVPIWIQIEQEPLRLFFLDPSLKLSIYLENPRAWWDQQLQLNSLKNMIFQSKSLAEI